jgi:hypothetical protein
MKGGSQTVPDTVEKILIPEFYYVLLPPDSSLDAWPLLILRLIFLPFHD